MHRTKCWVRGRWKVKAMSSDEICPLPSHWFFFWENVHGYSWCFWIVCAANTARATGNAVSPWHPNIRHCYLHWMFTSCDVTCILINIRVCHSFVVKKRIFNPPKTHEILWNITLIIFSYQIHINLLSFFIFEGFSISFQ